MKSFYQSLKKCTGSLDLKDYQTYHHYREKQQGQQHRPPQALFPPTPAVNGIGQRKHCAQSSGKAYENEDRAEMMSGQITVRLVESDTNHSQHETCQSNNGSHHRHAP